MRNTEKRFLDDFCEESSVKKSLGSLRGIFLNSDGTSVCGLKALHMHHFSVLSRGTNLVGNHGS